ncbi:MAG: hypothetical protein ACRYG7_46270 [Janthinobacterium lividum]
MDYRFIAPTLAPAAVHTLLAANRLEARPRSPEFNRALRAEVRDPTWLLARQWQMREFRAEDRGTPAYADVTMRERPLSRLALPGQDARDYAPRSQPLEAAVEAQPRPIGTGLRLQMGQYWRRQLRALTTLANGVAVADFFACSFPLRIPTAAEDPVAHSLASTMAEAQALLQLAGDAALDGYLLYQELLRPYRHALGTAVADSDQLARAVAALPLAQTLLAAAPYAVPSAGLGLGDGAELDEPARQFVLAFHRLYLLGAESTSWSTEDLAYGFAVSTADAVGLGAVNYPGGATLPWYAVDQQAAPAGTPASPAPSRRRLLATEVQFPGAPAARWWEFEDRRVDFGQVTGDPSDWGRMLLQEFMFLYQNDWFSVPYAVPVGSVCGVEQLQVTDVFGLRYVIQPAGAGTLTEADGTLIDNDENRWRLFAQTDLGQLAGPAPRPQLYVPAAVLAPLVSRPVEQVNFRREEATNLVWAVESIVPDGFAGGLDGAAAAAQVTEALRRLAPTGSPAAPSVTAAYTYQLVSAVPENWMPFVPVLSEDGTSGLEQGILERQQPGLAGAASLVQPRTALLQLHPAEPYRLHEHEVPPAGVRVDGQCYRARWYGGRTVLWFGRQRGTVQPGGSSGLRFDQLRSGSGGQE